MRRPRLTRVRPNVLPIELVSIADGDFKEELLRTRRAWITVEYRGGEVDCTVWRIDRLTPESNILRNLRSRPRFRALVGLRALCITNQTQVLLKAWQFQNNRLDHPTGGEPDGSDLCFLAEVRRLQKTRVFR